MKLPEKEKAHIPLAKLTNYILSEMHPVGKSKAKLFRALGFTEINVDLLRQGLIAIAKSEEVIDVISSEHGVKYIVDGFLKTPSRSSLKLRTIWIIDKGHVHPRFVTAYPL
jgi:hypothetical protein